MEENSGVLSDSQPQSVAGVESEQDVASQSCEVGAISVSPSQNVVQEVFNLTPSVSQPHEVVAPSVVFKHREVRCVDSQSDDVLTQAQNIQTDHQRSVPDVAKTGHQKSVPDAALSSSSDANAILPSSSSGRNDSFGNKQRPRRKKAQQKKQKGIDMFQLNDRDFSLVNLDDLGDDDLPMPCLGDDDLEDDDLGNDDLGDDGLGNAELRNEDLGRDDLGDDDLPSVPCHASSPARADRPVPLPVSEMSGWLADAGPLLDMGWTFGEVEFAAYKSYLQLRATPEMTGERFPSIREIVRTFCDAVRQLPENKRPVYLDTLRKDRMALYLSGDFEREFFGDELMLDSRGNMYFLGMHWDETRNQWHVL